MKNAKKTLVGCTAMILALSLSACAPSEEKIIQAQSTYRNLINTHNTVVAAHSEINDNSLDAELTALSANIPEIESYNLYEMTDSEIDSLIATMNTIMDSYAGYLKTIGEIKSEEEAKILTPVIITLINDTDMTFTGLSLYEKDVPEEEVNALESLSGLAPGQELIGLTIFKDSGNTPWILSLNDGISKDTKEEKTDEAAEKESDDEAAENAEYPYSIELDVAKYNSDKIILTIKKDEETGELSIE
jgi:hypothetical protein